MCNFSKQNEVLSTILENIKTAKSTSKSPTIHISQETAKFKNTHEFYFDQSFKEVGM